MGSRADTRRRGEVSAQFFGCEDSRDLRHEERDDASFQALLRDYRTWALEGFYEQPFAGGWTFTAEAAWFDRVDDYREAGIATRTLRGYYTQAGVLLPFQIGPGRFQPAFRREDWDTARGPQRATTTRNTVGATYFVSGHDRKVQADYTWKGETTRIKNDEFRVSVVLVFDEEP